MEEVVKVAAAIEMEATEDVAAANLVAAATV